jgi:hypothetical protein
MYEDKYKNKKDTNIDELDDFLRLLADINEDIELFAIGGTAMVLKGIKESTKDIDFLTNAKRKELRRILSKLGLKELSAGSPNIWQFEDIRIDFFMTMGRLWASPWEIIGEVIPN